MMPENKLKTCPFCGAKAELSLIPRSIYGTSLESWHISCPKARTNVLECVGSLYVNVLIGGVFGFDKVQALEKALELWNARKGQVK